jgi:hypothetical protein
MAGSQAAALADALAFYVMHGDDPDTVHLAGDVRGKLTAAGPESSPFALLVRRLTRAETLACVTAAELACASCADVDESIAFEQLCSALMAAPFMSARRAAATPDASAI